MPSQLQHEKNKTSEHGAAMVEVQAKGTRRRPCSVERRQRGLIYVAQRAEPDCSTRQAQPTAPNQCSQPVLHSLPNGAPARMSRIFWLEMWSNLGIWPIRRAAQLKMRSRQLSRPPRGQHREIYNCQDWRWKNQGKTIDKSNGTGRSKRASIVLAVDSRAYFKESLQLHTERKIFDL